MPLPKEKLFPGSRPRTVNGSDPALGCGCTEGMVPPHTVMLLVLQSLITELGLSPHPGAPELLAQTWQTLGESRLCLKALQPHSLRVIGMPSENRDISHFLPTAPQDRTQPPAEPGVGSVGRGQARGSARQSPAGQEPAQPESCWFSHPARLMSGPAPSAPSACKGQLQRLLQGVKPAAGSAGENLCFAFGFVKGKERSARACGGG